MKFTGLKYIEIDLNGKYIQSFPEIMDLSGRPILSIVATTNTPYKKDAQRADYTRLFLKIVDDKGQSSFVDNYPIENIADNENNGVLLNINKKINLPNCQIYNPNKIEGVVCLVIAYVKEEISYSLENSEVQYTDVNIKLDNGRRNKYYLPELVQLSGTKLKSIEVSQNSFSLLGLQTVLDNIDKYFLTIQKGLIKSIDKVPLTFFLQKNYWQKYELKNILFDTANSYIEVSENIGTVPANSVVSLIFKYSQ